MGYIGLFWFQCGCVGLCSIILNYVGLSFVGLCLITYNRNTPVYVRQCLIILGCAQLCEVVVDFAELFLSWLVCFQYVWM